ncbi:toxin-antitoxin system YwqK family antitoxin [Dyella agri]|uniref:Toxin-antitoxin system YwqK family antitoxin n=1 Tax=Dyella agri TaxID=1926869 RepID=A0ABW8KC82_9GAMM
MRIPYRILSTTCVVMALLALTGCSHPVLDYRNAEVSDGLIYAGGANEPFSGTVTHVPDSFMMNGEGHAKFMNEMGGAKYATARFVQAILGRDSSTSLCTISVRKGYVDGLAACYRPQSDTQIIEAHFVVGQLSGKFVYYNPDKPGEKLAEGSFEEGQPDGTQKIYSASTGELREKMHWSHGLYDGDYVTYNETNGKVVLKGAFVQGKREGTWMEYATTGEPLIAKEGYRHGLLQGVQEVFDADTGKRTRLVDQWVDGKISGSRKTWDKNGVLIDDETYADGTLVQHKDVSTKASNEVDSRAGDQAGAPAGSASPASPKQGAAETAPVGDQHEASTTLDACVGVWARVHRKAVGDDAMISADQLDEWRQWCAQGKHAPN